MSEEILENASLSSDTSVSTDDSSNSNIKMVIDTENKSENTVFKKLVIPKKLTKTNKTVADIYKKMSHVEHVLEKPDSYVGSCELEEIELDILDDSDDNNITIKKKNI